MEILDKIKGMFVTEDGKFKPATAIGAVIGGVALSILLPTAGVLAIVGGVAAGAFAGNAIGDRMATASAVNPDATVTPAPAGTSGVNPGPVSPNVPMGVGNNMGAGNGRPR